MQPSTTADQLASDLLVKILDKLNATENEEIVPTMEQMTPEESGKISSKVIKSIWNFTVFDVKKSANINN